jgi:hypothetical protein
MSRGPAPGVAPPPLPRGAGVVAAPPPFTDDRVQGASVDPASL